jgi:hypothetical protein
MSFPTFFNTCRPVEKAVESVERFDFSTGISRISPGPATEQTQLF